MMWAVVVEVYAALYTHLLLYLVYFHMVGMTFLVVGITVIGITFIVDVLRRV